MLYYIFINPITFSETIHEQYIIHSFPTGTIITSRVPKTNRFVPEIFIKIPNNIPEIIFSSVWSGHKTRADIPGSLIPRL